MHLYNAGMPNQRDPYKRNLQFYINEFTYARFAKLAKKCGNTMAEMLTTHIERRIKEENIILTNEENENVLRRIKARIDNSK